jgi:hypothetical protein
LSAVFHHSRLFIADLSPYVIGNLLDRQPAVDVSGPLVPTSMCHRRSA